MTASWGSQGVSHTVTMVAERLVAEVGHFVGAPTRLLCDQGYLQEPWDSDCLLLAKLILKSPIQLSRISTIHNGFPRKMVAQA
jgi:hypothetical protein